MLHNSKSGPVSVPQPATVFPCSAAAGVRRPWIGAGESSSGTNGAQIVGSPSTVIDKLGKMRDKVGEFGCLLQVIYDHLEEFEAYRYSLTALAEDVLPVFAGPERAAAE